MNTTYDEFLDNTRHKINKYGLSILPEIINNQLFDFQKDIVIWAIEKGRGAIFADCGLGKTPIQLEWANLISQSTDKPVLILAPLAVAPQTIREGAKFGIEVHKTDGEIFPGINITNYEKLHLFNHNDFVAVICDESSILKNFDGVRRQEITQFMKKLPYRLLCTATAAPNDYIELGTSSECLGEMGYTDMLGRFFINDQKVISPMRGRFGADKGWRFKGHAEIPFWQWVCSWSKALRKPSDLGYDDNGFILPPLYENELVVEPKTTKQGMLFDIDAIGFHEEREIIRRTIGERCEIASEKANKINEPVVIWCHLNDEAKLLTELIPGSQQVSGSDSDDKKEAKFEAFNQGNLRVLVTKPKIGAFGLNWQHCHNIIYFVSHSYEQYYQAVRRCWRFGQRYPVEVDIIRTKPQEKVMRNLQRKSEAADKMFSSLVQYMNKAQNIRIKYNGQNNMEVPEWLLSNSI